MGMGADHVPLQQQSATWATLTVATRSDEAPSCCSIVTRRQKCKVPHASANYSTTVGVDSSWYTAGIMHELPLIVFQIDYSKCPIQLPPVPPAHHLPMRVLAQMRHRKLGETGGHGHSNLHLEPTLASWHPRMARPRALAQASVERPRDEAPPATSWRPAGASQLLPPATLLHSIGLLRQA